MGVGSVNKAVDKEGWWRFGGRDQVGIEAATWAAAGLATSRELYEVVLEVVSST